MCLVAQNDSCNEWSMRNLQSQIGESYSLADFSLSPHNYSKSPLVYFRNFALLWGDKGKSASEQDLFPKCVLFVSWVQKNFAFEIYIFSRS